jgi:hypothetical protein
MKSRSIAFFLLGCTALLSVQSVGCGGDDGKEDSSGKSEAEIKDPDCLAITKACHDFDSGDGEASDCHITAHEDKGPACKKVRASCLKACAD